MPPVGYAQVPPLAVCQQDKEVVGSCLSVAEPLFAAHQSAAHGWSACSPSGFSPSPLRLPMPLQAGFFLPFLG